MGRVRHMDGAGTEQQRLAEHGVTFRGPAQPGAVTTPIEMRGVRHLWTDKETSGGFMLQLIEDPSMRDA